MALNTALISPYHLAIGTGAGQTDGLGWFHAIRERFIVTIRGWDTAFAAVRAITFWRTLGSTIQNAEKSKLLNLTLNDDTIKLYWKTLDLSLDFLIFYHFKRKSLSNIEGLSLIIPRKEKVKTSRDKFIIIGTFLHDVSYTYRLLIMSKQKHVTLKLMKLPLKINQFSKRTLGTKPVLQRHHNKREPCSFVRT